MKISWIFWWIVSGVWLLLFSIGAVFLWIREVDGAGAIQTTEIKLLSILTLLFAFLFPFIIQVIWALINFIVGKTKKENTPL